MTSLGTYQVLGEYSYLRSEVGFSGTFQVDGQGHIFGEIRDDIHSEISQRVKGSLQTLDGKIEMNFVKSPVSFLHLPIYYKLVNSKPQKGIEGEYKGLYYFNYDKTGTFVAHNPRTNKLKIERDVKKLGDKAHLTLTAGMEND